MKDDSLFKACAKASEPVKRFVVIDNISEDDKSKIIESLGYPFGTGIIKHGFDENTLPHICMKDDNLMHLFKEK